MRELLNKHSRICFDFWLSLDKIDILLVGWKLSSYWRSKGYSDDIED